MVAFHAIHSLLMSGNMFMPVGRRSRILRAAGGAQRTSSAMRSPHSSSSPLLPMNGQSPEKPRYHCRW